MKKKFLLFFIATTLCSSLNCMQQEKRYTQEKQEFNSPIYGHKTIIKPKDLKSILKEYGCSKDAENVVLSFSSVEEGSDTDNYFQTLFLHTTISVVEEKGKCIVQVSFNPAFIPFIKKAIESYNATVLLSGQEALQPRVLVVQQPRLQQNSTNQSQRFSSLIKVSAVLAAAGAFFTAGLMARDIYAHAHDYLARLITLQQ